jgi:hypothetical protein
LIERLGKKIGGAAADGFESTFEGVLRGHENDVNAGVATQRAREKFVGIRHIEVNAGKHQAAAAEANQAQCFFGIAGAHGFVAHVHDERIQRVTFRGIVVKNAGRHGTAYGRSIGGFVSGVAHDERTGTGCAKGEESVSLR